MKKNEAFRDVKRIDWCAERLTSLTYDGKFCQIEWTDGYGVWRYNQIRHGNDNKKAFRNVVDDAMAEETK